MILGVSKTKSIWVGGRPDGEERYDWEGVDGERGDGKDGEGEGA